MEHIFANVLGAVCNPLLFVPAIIGLVLLLFVLYYFLGRAVRRDQLLGSAVFAIIVFLLVIFTPLIVAWCASLGNVDPKQFLTNDIDKEGNNNIIWAVYYHFIDPGNQHIAQPRYQFLVGLISILGIFLLNGLLVTVLVNWFQQRQEQWRKGELRYTGGFLNSDCFLRNYVVIIGGNRMVASIIKQIADNERYIIVLTRRDADEFRRELFSMLPKNCHDKIIIYCGDCTSEEEIRNLQLEKAREVYILGEPTSESDNNSYHDAVNMRCFTIIDKCYKETEKVQRIFRKRSQTPSTDSTEDDNTYYVSLIQNIKPRLDELRKKCEALKDVKSSEIEIVAGRKIQYKDLCDEYEKQKSAYLRTVENAGRDELNGQRKENKGLQEEKEKRLVCRVMFEHQTTFSAFQFTDLNKNLGKDIDFRPFNYYETWAQQVLVSPELNLSNAMRYLPLEGREPIKKESNDYVHLIIIGMSRMGYAMAIEAAHLAHYPNFIDKKKRTRITFIDPNAKEEMSFFTNRFKEIFALSRSRYVEAREPELLYNGETERLYSDVDGWFDPLTDPLSTSPYRDGHLGTDFMDIEWEFVQGAIQWQQIQQYLEDAVLANNSRVTVAVCQPNNNEAVATAMYLHSTVLEKAQQILVYQRYDSSVIDCLNTAIFRPFGMEVDCFNIAGMNVQETIAEMFKKCYNAEYDRECKVQSDIETIIEVMNKLGKDINQFDDDAIIEALELIKRQKKNKEEKVKKEKDERKKRGEPDMGKSNSAKSWSNLYNSNTMWSKLRSVGYDGGLVIDEESLDVLMQVEHIRWTVEQLLLRYEPLIKKEQDEITQNGVRVRGSLFSETKEKYKGKKKHLDICSCERLAEIDPNTQVYDDRLTRIIPQCYKEIESKLNSIKK